MAAVVALAHAHPHIGARRGRPAHRGGEDAGAHAGPVTAGLVQQRRVARGRAVRAREIEVGERSEAPKLAGERAAFPLANWAA